MTQETKVLLVIVGICLLLLVGGVVIYNKTNQTSTAPVNIGANNPSLQHPDSQGIQANGAKVTVVEFADYECPFCKEIYPAINTMLETYKGKINFVYRNFPLPQHHYAMIAAEAAEIAGDQAKFWPMHDIIFQNQDAWANSTSSPKDLFVSYAKQIGLNTDQFSQSLNAEKYKDKIQRDYNDGTTLGVNATPTFFVDGIEDEGGQHLTTLINQELKK